jgi:ATP-dependent Clp endopeptidase proteolytic subunit ClpP
MDTRYAAIEFFSDNDGPVQKVARLGMITVVTMHFQRFWPMWGGWVARYHSSILSLGVYLVNMSDIKDRLNDAGIFHFSKGVNNTSVSEAIEFILEKNVNPGDQKHLTLLVSSWGGSVYAAFALTDIMEGSKLPVHTVGIGMIASCGLSIFMSGAKGHRTLTPNTEILSHQYYGFDEGKEHELIALRKRNDMTADRIMAHYKRHTGLSEKDIRKYLLPPEDRWLSAKDAKKYGLCDKIALV